MQSIQHLTLPLPFLPSYPVNNSPLFVLHRWVICSKIFLLPFQTTEPNVVTNSGSKLDRALQMCSDLFVKRYHNLVYIAAQFPCLLSVITLHSGCPNKYVPLLLLLYFQNYNALHIFPCWLFIPRYSSIICENCIGFDSLVFKVKAIM